MLHIMSLTAQDTVLHPVLDPNCDQENLKMSVYFLQELSGLLHHPKKKLLLMIIMNTKQVIQYS